MKNIQEWGNRRCKEYFECYLPNDFRRPQTDSAMEAFIRSKYEGKKYMKKDGPPPKKGSVPNATTVPSLKESKIERPIKREKKVTEEISSIPLKEIARKGSEPSPPSTESGKVPSLSLAKPRPHSHIQHHDMPQTKPALPSADLLSLDNPVDVQPFASQTTSSNMAAELIDFGGFQAHSADFSQPDQMLGPFAASTENTGDSLLRDDTKSTKDSIMALYKGSSAQQPQMFGIPGGMYIAPQQHMQQQQQLMPNSYNSPSGFAQQSVLPMNMPQAQFGHQSVQQVSQLQQQLQQMHINNQIQNQQPTFGNQHMFSDQTSTSSWVPQRPVSFQQQQPPQYVTTGPASSNSYGMYPMGTAPAGTGQTLSHSLWQ